MARIIIATVLLFLAVVSTSSKISYFEFNKLFSSPSSSKSIKCNEVLNTTSGTITYKLGEAYVPNERCTWTIRAPNATSYSFGIFEMGFPEPSNSHQITVAGITRDSQLVQVVPTQPGIYNVENANILIITFSTGPADNLNNHTGFSLQYLGVSSGITPNISSRSKDIIKESYLVDRLKYPDMGSFYENNMLATFVFTPQKNVFNETRENGLLYLSNGIEHDNRCGDHTDMYYFDVSKSPVGWEFQTQLCDHSAWFMIPHKDMVLAVFQSDEDDKVGFGINFITPGHCLP